MSGNVSTSTDARSGALDSIRVLDFTTVMSGPLATRLMADLGADVIKIESHEGDQVRARPPLREGYSAYFAHLNAGKRSFALDLKTPEAVAIIKELVQAVDVVVENFRPGVMARLGLSYEVLSALNSRLIYCSVSGYGQTGPRAQDPAYAPVVHAASGFDDVMRRYQGDGAKPATNGVFIADVLAASYAFGAIQTALFQRERTGEGQFVDVSMLEAMLGMLVFEVQSAQFPGDEDRPLHQPLKTLDGYVMVAAISARNFEQLCGATGHEAWLTDPRFSSVSQRNTNWKKLLHELEGWTAVRTAAEVEAIMKTHGVPCSGYCSVAEVLEDPQIKARQALTTISDGGGETRVVNAPFRLLASRNEVRNQVARLGQDGPDILRQELDCDEAEIRRLVQAGIVRLPD